MLSFVTAIVTVLLAATALASPVETDATNNRLFTRGLKTGEAKWYIPNTGFCGRFNIISDLVVAVAKEALKDRQLCGHKIRVEYKGKTVEVKAMHACEWCKPNDLDLSAEAFKKLVGPLSIGRRGRVPVQWDWIDEK